MVYSKGWKMRKYLGTALLIMFLLAAVPAANAWAAEGEGLKVDGSGKVTLTSSYAAQEGISSICFSLSVNSENAEKVQFRFDESAAKILEYRYDKENKRLNVYIAGTDALMKEGQSLSIGSIEVLDANGGGAPAEVSVAAGTLMYVYGTELKWMADLETAGAVKINASAAPPAQESDPSDSREPEPTPEPQPTKAPQAVPTPQPVTPYQPNIVRPTPTPQPTATPTPTPAPSESPAPEGSSEEPESTEAMHPQENDEGSSLEESEEAAGGIDWVFVIAIGAIVLFVAVVVMAVVVLKKKPSKSNGRDGED